MTETCWCGGGRAGYRKHRKTGETPCPAARAAEAAYAKERRAKATPSAPAADAPAIPEGAVTYLSIAEEDVSRWTTSFGYVEGSQTVTVNDGSIGLPVGQGLINRVLDLVEKQRPAVLLVSKDDATKLGRFGQLLTGLPRVKAAVTEDPTSWVPSTDGSRARHLAASSTGMITYAARVLEDRRDLDEQIEQQEHLPAGRRIVGATVAKGRMFKDLGTYEKPGIHRLVTIDGEQVEVPVYEELPHGHPALVNEVWSGPPLKKRRGLR